MFLKVKSLTELNKEISQAIAKVKKTGQLIPIDTLSPADMKKLYSAYSNNAKKNNQQILTQKDFITYLKPRLWVMVMQNQIVVYCPFLVCNYLPNNTVTQEIRRDIAGVWSVNYGRLINFSY